MSGFIINRRPDGVLATYVLGDSETLQVAVTASGIVIDAYSSDGDELVGTYTATADEWFNRLDD